MDLGIGLLRGMVTPGDAPLTENVGGYDFSTWRGGLVHNDDSDVYGVPFDDLAGSKTWQKDSSMLALLAGLGCPTANDLHPYFRAVCLNR